MKMFLFIAASMMNVSFAAEKKQPQFLDNKGVVLAFEQALKTSIAGGEVYKCQPVKITISKSGTSASFKVVK